MGIWKDHVPHIARRSIIGNSQDRLAWLCAAVRNEPLSTLSKDSEECEGCSKTVEASPVSSEGGAQTHFRYANLLREFGSRRALADGKLLHAEISKDGSDRETYLGNLLVDMYGKCGSPKEAGLVFDTIVQKNVFSWTILITAYAQNGRERESLKLFQRMCIEGVRPDRVTFASLAGACTSLGDITEGKAVHSYVVNAGLESDAVLGVALINMYAKTGDLYDARAAFDKMQLKNAVSYTAMIVAYTQSGQSREALELYREMNQEGVKADRVTFLSVLGACSDQQALAEGEVVHTCIACSGLESDDTVGSALVNMYGRCHRLHNAFRVFNYMPWKSVVIWNAMITAYAQNGHLEKALELYERMEMEGVTPDEVTFVEILGVCSSLQAVTKGRAMHTRLSARQLDSNIVVGNTLLNMYSECGSLEDARRVFEVLQGRDRVAWNTMIAAYAEHSSCREALQLYQRMDLEGFKPNDVTFISVLGACSSLHARTEGKLVHERIVACGFEAFIVVCNSLMQFYGACGELKDAETVFDRLHWKDEVSWNTMIRLYEQHRQSTEAVKCFQKMELQGVETNDVTFVSILGACSSLGELTMGKAVHARIVSCGLQSNVVIGTALVNMYGKFGILHEARSAFEKIRTRNTVSWNALISGYAQHRHSREAIEIFREMLTEGMKPDEATFVSMFFACSHGGLLDEAISCFTHLIQDHGIEATGEHFGCMVDLLARAGWLDKAEDLIKNMPFEPDATTWMSFLGGCKIHDDRKRGERIAKENAGIGADAAPYVMLSNIYAAEKHNNQNN